MPHPSTVYRTAAWGIVLAAMIAVYMPVSPAWVERLYSTRAYPALQQVLTSESNRVSFALVDACAVILVAAWIALAWRDARRASGRSRAAARIVARSVVWCAAAYLVFLATWGLNYRRAHFVDKLPYDAAAVTDDSALAAARVAVDRVNALHDAAHRGGWPPPDAANPELARAFERALRDLRLPSSIAVARPKRSMIDWYLRRSGTAGLTDPYFLETLVASDVLSFERPLVVAHEWSHLAGIADEGEANLAAFLTCLHGGAASQYSGWLFLYRELEGPMSRRNRASLAGALAAGPRDDLRAMRDRSLREVSPRLSEAGWRMYDSYLKVNRVEAGARSYGEVVTLVLGLRVDGRAIVVP
jgi:hypothetical protein